MLKKKDLKSKSSFLSLDFGHKGQSGVLAKHAVFESFTSKNLLQIFFMNKNEHFGSNLVNL